MAFRSGLYATIAKDFQEWCPVGNTGSVIADLSLRFLNRAQQSLNIYRPWKGLIKKKQTLTLTGKAGTYPVDCAKIEQCYADSDNDGLPSNFFYENTNTTEDGYYVSKAFSKSSGWSATINFYSSPGDIVYLDYLMILDDFTGEGDEYSFFPSEVLLKKAQLFYLEQDGRVGTGEYQMLLNSFNNELNDFTQNQVENLEMVMVAKDSNGNEVGVESYSLASGSNDDSTSNYDRDVDV